MAIFVRLTGNYLNVFYTFIAMNLTLAFFNLIPIPPLDGSKILLNLLPFENSLALENFFEKFGPILLIAALILPFGSGNLISALITPPIQFTLRLLLG